MKAMKVVQYTLPMHWGPALINDDPTGYEPDDLKAIRAFTKDMVKQYGSCWCINVEDDMGFYVFHDAKIYGVLGTDCSTFTFDVTADEEIEA